MNVPALRFKEFTDAWRDTSLGNVSNGVMYGMNAAAIPYDGINKYIRITDIDEASRAFIPSPLSSPDGEIEDKFKLKNGDLVFARTGASVGKSYLYKEKDGNLLFAGFLVKFSVVRANPYFVYSQTLTPSYKRWLTVMSMRSGQPGVNAEELKEFKFLTPQLSEQTKIANFLTAVDEKINQLTQKHDLLTQYKKGVIQQIFSQELRFKDDDGKDFPEWEEKTIDTVAEVTTGDKDTQNKIDDGAYPFFVRSQTVERINSYSIDGEAILTSGDGVGVGKNYHYINGKFDFHQRVYCLYNFKKDVNGKFVFHYFSEHFNKRVMQLSAKNSVDSVRRSMITDMPIHIPTYKEQTKIANFLSAIDNKITVTQTQLQAIKQYKQGLLQQMFV